MAKYFNRLRCGCVAFAFNFSIYLKPGLYVVFSVWTLSLYLFCILNISICKTEQPLSVRYPNCRGVNTLVNDRARLRLNCDWLTALFINSSSLPPPPPPHAHSYIFHGTVESRNLEVGGTMFYKFKLPEVQINLHFG